MKFIKVQQFITFIYVSFNFIDSIWDLKRQRALDWDALVFYGLLGVLLILLYMGTSRRRISLLVHIHNGHASACLTCVCKPDHSEGNSDDL